MNARQQALCAMVDRNAVVYDENGNVTVDFKN